MASYKNIFNFLLRHFSAFIPEKIRTKLSGSDTRSREFVKNVILSVVMKAANILAGLLVVSMTISYINPTQYGIWLTLSSIIGWIIFFDLGLGNGFRNKFAESKAKGDILLARKYLSTTYFATTAIVVVVFIGIFILNHFLDWSQILNVPASYKEELHVIFIIVSSFTCLNMIANTFTALLSADQQPGYAAVIQGIGQYLSVAVIYLLTQFSEGSLLNLAIFYSGIPCLVMLATSLLMFKYSRYRTYTPKIALIRVNLIKEILSLGSKFFLIYLCLIAIFQVVNIVISRELGAYAVTQYNIANKYFNTISMVMIMVITPLWSSFTDAYTKQDFKWMKNMVRNMEISLGVCFIIGLLMFAISDLFYGIWIGDKVTIPISLSFGMFLFTIAQTFGNIYMYMINGIGTIRIQLITYVVFALLSWPLFTFCSRHFGLMGVVLVPTLVYIFQGILGKVQISKLLNKRATGIWSK